jgi:aspartyl-tRNA(Asn)/glutamyl-tRNA(Gln) amidotransferase subunit B
MAKQVFADMVCTGKLPEQVIKDKGWKQVTDQSELEAIVDNVISAHEKEVQRYRSGKKGLIGFFVGEAMKATAGRADPKLLNLLLRKKLG